MVEAGSLMDSITGSEENPWQSELVWKKGIINLNDTVERANEAIGRVNNGLKIVREIRKIEAEPEVIDLVNENQEKAKKKRVTFDIEYGRCTQVLDEVVKSLEMITGINIDNTPRTQIERIIRILVAVCIDLYSQMQSSQVTMGAMADLIEDYMEKGEEAEEIRRNEKKLKSDVTELEEQIKELERFNKHLSSFIKPGSKQKDLDNIIKEKVENEKLKEEIETLEDKLRNKVK